MTKPAQSNVSNTEKRKARFLQELEESKGVVTYAAKAVGVRRETAYRWRAADPEFAEQWMAIIDSTTEDLEREAYRRAFEGVEEPVYQGGKLVGTQRKFSDTLTIFLLKGRKPRMYRDNMTVEHTGKDGGPVQIRADLGRLTEAQLREWENLRSLVEGDPDSDDNDGSDSV